jgi:hypothetical protein
VEFTLHYRGPLKAASGKNRRKDHKHDLRKHFHKQLKELWTLPQLKDVEDYLEAGPTPQGEIRLRQSVGAFEFVPLVSPRIFLVANIEMMMLRPEPEGAIFTRGGDIDNRLKTLMDALKVPNEESALPDGISPSPDESPFFCLLTDDSLITGIDIKTAHWLEPEIQETDEVVLTLRVRTKPTKIIFGNMAFL